MGLLKSSKHSPAEEDLLFAYDPKPAEEALTVYAGIPPFVHAGRSLGVVTSVKRHVRVKQRDRGLDEAAYVESFLVLNALGGELGDVHDRYLSRGDGGPRCSSGGRTWVRWKQRCRHRSPGPLAGQLLAKEDGEYSTGIVGKFQLALTLSVSAQFSPKRTYKSAPQA